LLFIIYSIIYCHSYGTFILLFWWPFDHLRCIHLLSFIMYPHCCCYSIHLFICYHLSFDTIHYILTHLFHFICWFILFIHSVVHTFIWYIHSVLDDSFPTFISHLFIHLLFLLMLICSFLTSLSLFIIYSHLSFWWFLLDTDGIHSFIHFDSFLLSFIRLFLFIPLLWLVRACWHYCTLLVLHSLPLFTFISVLVTLLFLIPIVHTSCCIHDVHSVFIHSINHLTCCYVDYSFDHSDDSFIDVFDDFDAVTLWCYIHSIVVIRLIIYCSFIYSFLIVVTFIHCYIFIHSFDVPVHKFVVTFIWCILLPHSHTHFIHVVVIVIDWWYDVVYCPLFYCDIDIYSIFHWWLIRYLIVDVTFIYWYIIHWCYLTDYLTFHFICWPFTLIDYSIHLHSFDLIIYSFIHCYLIPFLWFTFICWYWYYSLRYHSVHSICCSLHWCYYICCWWSLIHFLFICYCTFCLMYSLFIIHGGSIHSYIPHSLFTLLLLCIHIVGIGSMIYTLYSLFKWLTIVIHSWLWCVALRYWWWPVIHCWNCIRWSLLLLFCVIIDIRYWPIIPSHYWFIVDDPILVDDIRYSCILFIIYSDVTWWYWYPIFYSPDVVIIIASIIIIHCDDILYIVIGDVFIDYYWLVIIRLFVLLLLFNDWLLTDIWPLLHYYSFIPLDCCYSKSFYYILKLIHWSDVIVIDNVMIDIEIDYWRDYYSVFSILCGDYWPR